MGLPSLAVVVSWPQINMFTTKTAALLLPNNGQQHVRGMATLKQISLDADVIECFQEYSLASLLFYALKEGACSEQSARMTAMDNASKNASEMIDKLTLTFNRTRQAVIT